MLAWTAFEDINSEILARRCGLSDRPRGGSKGGGEKLAAQAAKV